MWIHTERLKHSVIVLDVILQGIVACFSISWAFDIEEGCPLKPDKMSSELDCFYTTHWWDTNSHSQYLGKFHWFILIQFLWTTSFTLWTLRKGREIFAKMFWYSLNIYIIGKTITAQCYYHHVYLVIFSILSQIHFLFLMQFHF